jgi:hypothetical protein
VCGASTLKDSAYCELFSEFDFEHFLSARRISIGIFRTHSSCNGRQHLLGDIQMAV